MTDRLPLPPDGSPQQGPPIGGPPPASHLVWAILTTVFCCQPFGIVSIVRAAKVTSLWSAGQYAEAQRCADDAKKWALISGIVYCVAIGVLALVAALG